MPSCWQIQQHACPRLSPGSTDAPLTPEMRLLPTRRSWKHGGHVAGTAPPLSLDGRKGSGRGKPPEKVTGHCTLGLAPSPT